MAVGAAVVAASAPLCRALSLLALLVRVAVAALLSPMAAPPPAAVVGVMVVVSRLTDFAV